MVSVCVTADRGDGSEMYTLSLTSGNLTNQGKICSSHGAHYVGTHQWMHGGRELGMLCRLSDNCLYVSCEGEIDHGSLHQ